MNMEMAAKMETNTGTKVGKWSAWLRKQDSGQIVLGYTAAGVVLEMSLRMQVRSSGGKGRGGRGGREGRSGNMRVALLLAYLEKGECGNECYVTLRISTRTYANPYPA